MTRYKQATTAGLWFALLSGLFSLNALAESIPPRGPIPFAAFDQDGNGMISEQEFLTVREQRMASRAAEGRPMHGASNPPSFAEFDTDADGQLSPEELASGQQSQMQKRQTMGTGIGPGKAHGMETGRNMPAFADFDLDGDGKIITTEFDEARNRRIEERVQQGYMMKNLANAPTFDQLDTDTDGAISPEEFAAHQVQRQQQKSQ